MTNPLPWAATRAEAISARRAEQALTGRALRTVRLAAGLTLKQAAAALDPPITHQAWRRYEIGAVAFNAERIASLAAALGRPASAIIEAREAILATMGRRQGGSRLTPVWTATRMGPMGPEVHTGAGPGRTVDLAEACGAVAGGVVLPTDALAPWARAGATVFYSAAHWPRPGAGVVVELVGGALRVGLLVRADPDGVTLAETNPPREYTVPQTQIGALYGALWRTD